jgi:hypothetical protein
MEIEPLSEALWFEQKELKTTDNLQNNSPTYGYTLSLGAFRLSLIKSCLIFII